MLSDYLVSILERNELKEKLAAFCADEKLVCASRITLIGKCFAVSALELFLRFVHGQLKYFHETITK